MRFTLEFPVFTVKKLLNLKSKDNLNLNPGFQRNSVWEEKDKALLIDSILQYVPLPSMLLWHEKQGQKNIYHVVDGKQRIETIIEFTKYKNPFSYQPSVVKKHHKNKDWSGLYDDLGCEDVSYKWLSKNSLTLRKQFDKFRIPTVVVKDANSLEDIRELFVRVNSTGMKLTPQEVRNARFLNSNLLLEAERIASQKSIYKILLQNKIFTDAQFKRMKVVEFITELMLSIKSKDVLDKKISIDEMMEAKLTNPQVKKLGKEAKSIIKYIAEFISDRDNRLKTSRFKNTADLYALAFCFWKMEKTKGMIIRDKIRAEMAFSILVDLDKQLKRYGQAHKEGKGFRALPDVAMRYQKTIASSTDSGPNRSDRVSIIKDLIEPVFVKKDTDRIFSRDLKELLWHSSDKICTLCSKPIKKFDDLEIDHRFAHAKGGQTNSANAQIAHSLCNKLKGKKS